MSRPKIPKGTLFSFDESSFNRAGLSAYCRRYLTELEEKGHSIRDARLSMALDDGSPNPYFWGVFPDGSQTEYKMVTILSGLVMLSDNPQNDKGMPYKVLDSVIVLREFKNSSRGGLTGPEINALLELLKYIEGEV